MTKCIGCGSELQTNDKNLKGYIPLEKSDAIYCERCFRIQHYNKHEHDFSPLSAYTIIKHINKNKGITFFLTDFLNISSEVLNTFKMIKNPKILVISKEDILPKSINKNRIRDWLKNTYDIDTEVIFNTSKSSSNFEVLETKLKKYGVDRAYICGYTNAGKSTFINSVLKNKQITTSSTPNTTLDFIRIDTGSFLIVDTPGFISKSLESTTFVSNKTLKPLTYQVKPGQSYMIGDLGSIDVVDKNSFTFYFSPILNLTRNYTKRLNNNKIVIPKCSDLVIKNVGFINIKKECLVYVSDELLNMLEVRPSCFESRD